MTVADVIAQRNIEEILHFTTNKGVLGILDSRSLKSRERLLADQRLEYILQPNAADRSKDAAWLDYVNLSISRINSNFFSVSSGNWHKDKNLWWCILSFVPEILAHDGVFFTTTNNIYTGVRRDSGPAGLENMFAEQITQWIGRVVRRDAAIADNWPTCVQAEVLYPAQVSTEYLQKIYVNDEQSADELAGQLSMLRHPIVPIEIRPELFTSSFRPGR